MGKVQGQTLAAQVRPSNEDGERNIVIKFGLRPRIKRAPRGDWESPINHEASFIDPKSPGCCDSQSQFSFHSTYRQSVEP
jgi:hypothetical protein